MYTKQSMDPKYGPMHRHGLSLRALNLKSSCVQCWRVAKSLDLEIRPGNGNNASWLDWIVPNTGKPPAKGAPSFPPKAIMGYLAQERAAIEAAEVASHVMLNPEEIKGIIVGGVYWNMAGPALAGATAVCIPDEM